tara:strand:+ start:35 stop:379 length:345 start_codon:yes stop_codon:yes gene_type:complete
MKITFGYAKDVLACFMFVLIAITVIRFRINYNTNFVLLILFLALILDGLFSVFPRLHNTEIKEEHFDQPFFERPLIKTLYESEYVPLYIVFLIIFLLFSLSSIIGYVFHTNRKN